MRCFLVVCGLPRGRAPPSICSECAARAGKDVRERVSNFARAPPSAARGSTLTTTAYTRTGPLRTRWRRRPRLARHHRPARRIAAAAEGPGRAPSEGGAACSSRLAHGGQRDPPFAISTISRPPARAACLEAVARRCSAQKGHGASDACEPTLPRQPQDAPPLQRGARGHAGRQSAARRTAEFVATLRPSCSRACTYLSHAPPSASLIFRSRRMTGRSARGGSSRPQCWLHRRSAGCAARTARVAATRIVARSGCMAARVLRACELS